jgi:UDP-galactose transporter
MGVIGCSVYGCYFGSKSAKCQHLKGGRRNESSHRFVSSFFCYFNSNQCILGFTSACTACAISGFAGVYFERILKGSAPVSVWMRNVQMGVFSIPVALLGAFLQDGSQIQEKGFLFGFDAVVWFVAFWYGIGGLSVAVCIKYADNIAKNFATSVAIILATIGSIYIFDFHPNLMFVAGAGLVITSIFLYSSSSVVTTRIRSSKA